MNRINLLFSLSSLSVLLVTIERFSFTTQILLGPYNFMRLHELTQMIVLILLTVIIPFLLLREITQNFATLKTQKGFLLMLLFVIGVYFYATGNGVHEVSSFNFNHYCDTKNFSDNLCGGFFVNDYYTGNIMYFAGGAFMVLSLLLLEKLTPNKNFPRNGIRVLTANALIYAFAIFAYAAFDRVLIGLIYSAVMTSVSLYLFWGIRKKYLNYPVITYTAITYTVGTVAALLVRLI